MMDFWSLFVEYTFGGFYTAIVSLAGIFLVILMMGGVSIYTALWFCGIFLFVMCLGNGSWIIVMPVSILIIYILVRGMTAFFESYSRI